MSRRVRIAINAEARSPKVTSGEEVRLSDGTFIRGGLSSGTMGRPPGMGNVVSRRLKQAVLLAAESVGEDGKGKGKLQGYLKRLAIYEAPSFASLLKRLLPQTIIDETPPHVDASPLNSLRVLESLADEDLERIEALLNRLKPQAQSTGSRAPALNGVQDATVVTLSKDDYQPN